MYVDISDYGFLQGRVFFVSDFLIMARFIIFVPLCIYEIYKIYKCIKKEKAEENRNKHRRHHSRYRSHIRSKGLSNAMDAEYEKKTYFMDTEALLKKQLEEKTKIENKSNS